MPIIEASHPYFEDGSFFFVGFNVEGTIAYCSSAHSICYHTICYNVASRVTVMRKFVEFFRISRFGGSVHRIAKIQLPCSPETMYDAKNEEIVWLGRIEYRPLLSRLNLPQGSDLLTLVTFNLANGILKRYYNISDVNRSWTLIRKEDDRLFACNVDDWNDTLNICIVVTCLDFTDETFNLCPYLNVPFYDTLATRYHFHGLTIAKDQLTVLYCNVPGQMFYFKLDTKQWIRENYVAETIDKNFKLFVSYFCEGQRIVEVIINETYSKRYRFLTVDQHPVWRLVFQVPVPPEDYLSASPCTKDGELFGYVRCENSTLTVTMRTCVPCTLLEACISVVWPRSRQMNPRLTDYEICDRLGLSHHVNMNIYFGKRFTD